MKVLALLLIALCVAYATAQASSQECKCNFVEILPILIFTGRKEKRLFSVRF